MSDALFLEFAGVTADQYRAVNRILGLNPANLDGPWPIGLHSQTAAVGPSGNLIVFEVWESAEAEADWMDSRMGSALVRAGMPEPKRAEWLSIVGSYQP